MLIVLFTLLTGETLQTLLLTLVALCSAFEAEPVRVTYRQEVGTIRRLILSLTEGYNTLQGESWLNNQIHNRIRF